MRGEFEALFGAQPVGPWLAAGMMLLVFCLGLLQRAAERRISGSQRVRWEAGVLAVGAAMLVPLQHMVPAQVVPWLGLLAGVTLAGVGVYLPLRRVLGAQMEHTHLPGEGHGRSGLRLRAGAALPCPATLAVLLSAFAVRRVGMGLLLLAMYGGGMLAGMVLPGEGLSRRWTPMLLSGLVGALGLAVAYAAVVASHVTTRLFTENLTRERLGPVLFLTGLGLVLGMRHSTDADHVVAISTIVSKQRGIGRAALIGSVWGLGHTIMIFAVGALIILAGIRIPPRVGLAMEFTVALMLILLGSLNLTGVTQRLMARYTPGPDRLADDVRSGGGARGAAGRMGVVQLVRPLVIGLVHGLAGSAAVALLVLSTIHNPAWATIYLLIFGFGTVIGMMIMTAAIAVPLTYAGDRFTNLSRYFGIGSGVISMCFGLFLVYQLGFVGGLFTSHPHWTPQ